MKKVIGIMLVMVIIAIITTMYSANADTIVKEHDAYDVINWVDEWAEQNGYEYYIENQGRLVDDCFIARGVVVNQDFINRYGVEFDIHTCEDALEKEYGPIDMSIRKVGEYEGYDVFVMTAKAEVPIGTCYKDDNVIEYYETNMLFMIVEQY